MSMRGFGVYLHSHMSFTWASEISPLFTASPKPSQKKKKKARLPYLFKIRYMVQDRNMVTLTLTA